MIKSEKLRNITSLLVRLMASDSNGYCRCVTCGKIDHYKNMQAGHFIPTGKLITKYDLQNIHVQCENCNCFLRGNLVCYESYLIETYGIEVVEELKRKSHIIVKNFNYDKLIEEYGEKLKLEKLRVL